MSTKLKPTNQLILVEGELLGHLELDEAGTLGVTHEVLHKTLEVIAGAVNTSHDQITNLEKDADELHETIEALKQLCAKLDHRIQECEDFSREMRVQVGTLMTGGGSGFDGDDVGSNEELSAQSMQAENVNMLLEKIEALNERMDELGQASQQQLGRLGDNVLQASKRLDGLQDLVEETVEVRLSQFDDIITQQKMDVDALRSGLQEADHRFSKRTDMIDLQKKMDDLLSELSHEKSRMEVVHGNLEKIESALELSATNKALLKEMNKKMREESDENRDWCAKNFQDLRDAIQKVSFSLTEETPLVALRREIHKSLHELSEATAQNEQRLRKKAEQSDLIRLRDEVGVFALNVGRPRQLLVGKRCLACDSDTSVGEVTDRPVEEISRTYQQEDLFREVHDAMKKAEFGSTNVLRYVSVHVGGPGRSPGKDGSGWYEVRDMNDTSLGSHRLVKSPQTPRPNTGACSTAGQTTIGDPVPRAPPREPVPFVRIPPRKRGPPSWVNPPSYDRGRTAPPRRSLLLGASPNTTHNSVRSAIGHYAPPSQQPGATQSAEGNLAASDPPEYLPHASALAAEQPGASGAVYTSGQSEGSNRGFAPGGQDHEDVQGFELATH